MQGGIARVLGDEQTTPEQRHEGGRLALKAGRQSHAPDFEVVFPSGEVGFDPGVHMLEIRLAASWQLR